MRFLKFTHLFEIWKRKFFYIFKSQLSKNTQTIDFLRKIIVPIALF